MSENPLQCLMKTMEKVSQAVQTHLSQFIRLPNDSSITHEQPFISLSPPAQTSRSNSNLDSAPTHHKDILNKAKTAAPVTKEELGRATWTFLHTLAAQYPDRPTRQQKKDVKELMAILSRMYPCKECADHFKEVLSANPVQAGSQAEFSQWLCHVHNVVNRSLGKLVFPCERVDARWGKLDCEQRSCDLHGAMPTFGNGRD